LKDRDLEKGAEAIADNLKLPGGRRKKFSRVVEDHLAWFDAAEARGLTWADMSIVLAAAGATGDDGSPLSVGTLSSAVWRKRKEASQPPRLDRQQDDRRAAITGAAAKSTVPGSPSARSKLEARGRDSRARGHDSKSSTAAKNEASATVLAYMKRAARMRQVKADR